MAKKVTFTLSAEVVGEATSGLLLGEFNNWDYNDGIILIKQKDGALKATTLLETGKRYEYRYLLNDGRWVNDQNADHYVHISGFHVENCVINVAVDGTKVSATEKKVIAEKVPSAAKKVAVSKTKTPAEKIVTSKAVASEKAPVKVKATTKKTIK